PQSEDCLSLNVYTPSHTTAQDKLAVMVWIHGGGFNADSARRFDPSALVALNDVIVVSINYRLGVLGFFNIPGTDVKGNYAMHDQIQSLKWVQQNIAAFGGDPDQVTIFGHSAGGISVSNHLISPLSKGLFRRVIAQSGSSVNPFSGIRSNSTKALGTFSKALSCDITAATDQLMACLRSKNVSEIFSAQLQVSLPAMKADPSLVTVVVDGDFLPDDPKVLLKQGRVNKADVMLGVTANEGGIYALVAPDVFNEGINLNVMEMMIRQHLVLTGPLTANQNKLVEDATLFEYLDHRDLGNRIKHRQALFDVSSDSMFNAPAIFQTSALAQTGNPVYFYVFDHHPHFSKSPTWTGAYHAVDVPFTLGMPFKSDGFSEVFKAIFSEFSDLEAGLSRYVMKLWTNFAKHGDPNRGSVTPVTWPRYNSTGHVHLRISMEPKVEHSLRERKVAFWNEFIPKLTGNKAIDEARVDAMKDTKNEAKGEL
ncbi:hypothetical protein QZH41_010905, partial [Actinostola sp. cb2023]